jgi:hypothetical protein
MPICVVGMFVLRGWASRLARANQHNQNIRRNQ